MMADLFPLAAAFGTGCGVTAMLYAIWNSSTVTFVLRKASPSDNPDEVDSPLPSAGDFAVINARCTAISAGLTAKQVEAIDGIAQRRATDAAASVIRRLGRAQERGLG